MIRLFTKIRKLGDVLLDERGQDLVEYVLVALLISLAAVVIVKSVATSVGAAFTTLGTKLGTYIS